MLTHPHRTRQGKRMAGARLFLARRAHPDIVAELARDRFEHGEAGGVIAIVVGDEDTHDLSFISVRTELVEACPERLPWQAVEGGRSFLQAERSEDDTSELQALIG